MAGLVLAARIATLTIENNRQAAEARFAAAVNQVGDQLRERLRTYEYGLRGARGAVIAAGGEAVTRQRFGDYIRSRDIRQEFPGAMGFGFIRRVPADREAQFLAAARADGAPDFQIRQFARHDGERWIIQYIEPEEVNRPALGLDIASEAHRHAAALTAMTTGNAVLTGPVTLVQSGLAANRAFLFTLAVAPPDHGRMEAGARTPVIGWVYAPLVIDHILEGIEPETAEVAYSLTDVSEAGQELTFFKAGMLPPGASATLQTRQLLNLYGRLWRLDATALPGFTEPRRLRDSPAISSAIFALSAVLLASLSHLYLQGLRRRERAFLVQAQLAAVVENSADAMMSMTLEGVVTSWNKAAERLFGLASDQAVGRRFGTLLEAVGEPQDERQLLARIAELDSIERLITVRRSRGETLSLAISASAIRRPDGTVAGAAMTVRDITESLSAQAQVRELNATLEQQVAQRTAQVRTYSALQRAILSHAGYAIIATDGAGTITLFNPAAEKMLGYAADELIGSAGPGVFHDPGEVAARAAALTRELGHPVPAGFDAFIAKTRSTGQPDVNEWTYIAKGGHRLPVLLSVVALRDDGGELFGYLGIAADLAERKRTEAALHRAKESAEAANRAKSEFLANMSHEIRTPMNGIIGMVELLLDTGLSPEQRRQAEIVRDNADALLTILNDILDVSKLEAGRVELEQVDFSLGELVTGITALLAPQAQAKGIAIAADLDLSVAGRWRGDPTRLRQVLINIAGNAVKFTDRGRVDIDVRPAGQGVRIEVRDTGIGMTTDQAARVFQKFSQGDGSIARRYGGTGLGLAICRELVALMGGTLGVESAPGRGSLFWFELPLQRSAPEAAIAAPATPAAAGVPPVPGGRILLAEDNSTNQVIAATTLRKAGYGVAIAGNGIEAVELWRQGGFDAVLMDIHMPEMDGMEATRQIRALEQRDGRGRTPIIALTANAMAGARDSCLAAGMDDHIGKPFKRSRLLETLARALRGAPPAPSATVEEHAEELLDRRVLEELGQDVDPIAFADMVEEFVRTGVDRVGRIGELAAAGDLPGLRRQGHDLISTAGSCGLGRLHGLGVRLREAAASGDGDAARRVAAEIATVGPLSWRLLHERFGGPPPTRRGPYVAQKHPPEIA
jgi:PAS domain S-box-containing protein